MSIVVEDLIKRYSGHPVVNNVSLEVGDGELFVLLGSSGSGKSTLLRMIAGLTEIDGGRILLHGRDVTDLPPAQRGVVASFLGSANLMVGESTASRTVTKGEYRRASASVESSFSKRLALPPGNVITTSSRCY